MGWAKSLAFPSPNGWYSPMKNAVAAACISLMSCTPQTEKEISAPRDTAASSQETDTDSDTDTDTDTDSDTDTDTDTDADVTALTVAADFSEISTKELVVLTAMATHADGSETDVSRDATWSSSDEAVVKFYEAAVGQPLWDGSAILTGSYAGYDGTVDVTVTLAAAGAGDLVINELLIDGTINGDPNGDGSLSATEDEFIEIANSADATVDLGGVTLQELGTPGLPRHTFTEGTVLRAGESIVVFGGGDVSTLTDAGHANVSFVVADNEDSALEYGLSLNNDGDHVWVYAADGSTVIDDIAYGDSDFTGTIDAIQDASLVLDPDVWGTDYTHHSYATDSAGDISPGTYTDGSAYPGPDGRYDGAR